MNRLLPTTPGFYWAKWTSAYPGTRDGPLAGCEDWIVVQVFENADPDHAEHLLVLVPGVETAQSLENLYWGVGPISPIAVDQYVVYCAGSC